MTVFEKLRFYRDVTCCYNKHSGFADIYTTDRGYVFLIGSMVFNDPDYNSIIAPCRDGNRYTIFTDTIEFISIYGSGTPRKVREPDQILETLRLLNEYIEVYHDDL